MTKNKDSQQSMDYLEDERILAQAFLENYISVVKLDLSSGEAYVLKSEYDQEIERKACSWPELVQRYAQRRAYPPDKEVVLSLTLEKLRRFAETGEGNFPLEIRCQPVGGNYEFQWTELSANRIGSDIDQVLITTRNINETRLIRCIVDLFVYQNYDYLYLIDAKTDSYTRFTGRKGSTPVPPEKGEHYTEDMIHYNSKYVVPEDIERVTSNMRLPHVMEMLEQRDMYSFTSSGITKDGRYRHSRVVFLYYDKSSKLILTARTDVTQIYLEEQEKARQLAEALRNAQHDAMTGIYNQKATAELVKRSLGGQYRSTAAVLFVDVDNFKMVNDTLGHQKGDELLCVLARRLQEIAGRDGIAGRIGGDEFLLYLPNIPNKHEVKGIATQICRLFDTEPDEAFKELEVSCSVGISIYPHDGTNYETLLRKSDQALYTAKRYGKKQYYLYSCEGNLPEQ